ncbi:uncharacterized protein KGF55_002574 [Candida pseudojiufengensis]|uniref:uncharacterized protein n=1 Tax=Candida pseudojiufengensis TaxID=497109 RepID=UPI002224FFAD|nr:uncharacterized protein KGF55_002574 [Candida pseudojiufengensis]KAI5963694.1 hypothetical protein KGF55_002574 [Candida pseudojiufengensis]
MLDSFLQKKQNILREISQNGNDNLDASPKGTIDEHCIPIINLINTHPKMVTTSSCSGRVSVYLEGTQNNKIISKGNEGKWIFVTHDTSNLKNWYKSINLNYDLTKFPTKNARKILYKFEPLILHIKCKDSSIANTIYQIAMNCGFRESGIGSNYNVAIRISIKLDIPIGYKDEKPDDNGEEVYQCFVTEEYLSYITKVSFDRFEENFKKLDQLYAAIDKFIKEFPADEENNVEELQKKNKIRKDGWESKEERRARMKKEGLDRKEQLRRAKSNEPNFVVDAST